ncbi:hypothetical protein ACFQY0_18475 [Haloferula chungangensis]|uniref:Uncharacterized protein n=1 Tax=Haloferula chungangensis TaxID=1048331 RepID=A0ABW2LEH5_9BACT
MNLKKLLPILLACAVLPGHAETEAPANAGKSYVLVSENPERPVGLETTISDVMSMENGKISMGTPQGDFEGNMEMKTTKVTETKNESESKIIAKVTRSETLQKMTMNGQEMPQPPQMLPLVGMPLVLTLKDGEWSGVREDGGEFNEAEQAELSNVERSVSGIEDKNIYGTEPRKPGDTWTVDAKDMAMVDAADDVNGSVKMSFDKVGEHEGTECAFLTGKIEMSGSAPGGTEADGTMSLNGTFKIIRSLKHQVDLVRNMDGTMKIEMKTPAGAMKMSGPTVMKRTVEVK